MTGQQLPVAKFKAGQVQAAIWENTVQLRDRTATMLKVTIQRRYKSKSGEWQSSGSFGRNEIPLAIYCLQKAFDKIIERQNDEAIGGEPEEIAI